MCVYRCLDYIEASIISMVEKLKLNGRGHSTNRNVYHLFYVWACLYPILENQLEWMSGDLHYYLYGLEFRGMVNPISSLVNPILWCIRSVVWGIRFMGLFMSFFILFIFFIRRAHEKL